MYILVEHALHQSNIVWVVSSLILYGAKTMGGATACEYCNFRRLPLFPRRRGNKQETFHNYVRGSCEFLPPPPSKNA